MRNSTLLILFFACIFCNSRAQNDSVTLKLDAYLTTANKMHKFNGNALVMQDGKVLLQKSYGYQNIETNKLNDPNTVFRICSVTKQFTAAVVMKLQEEGKLSIHDKLSKYFPQYKYADKITLEQLLTHESGLYDYITDIDAVDSAIVCHPVDKQLATGMIFKHKLYFTPGTAYRYCNSGYYLLGLIIEQVTGKPYEQNVRDIIFTPLQMSHSFFDFNNIQLPVATGYEHITDTGAIEASAWRWDSTVSYAAGAIFSTTADMYKWVQAIASRQLLSSASWQAIFTPHLEKYGFGFYIDSIFNTTAYSHGGGLPGFTSYLCYYPSEKLCIILLCNQGWFNDALNATSTDLSAIAFHQPVEILQGTAAIQLPADLLQQYVGKYEFDKKHHAYITIQNGQLQMEAPEGGLPRSPLFASGETSFFLEVIHARIEFIKDTTGNVTGFTAFYAGKAETCKKLK